MKRIKRNWNFLKALISNTVEYPNPRDWRENWNDAITFSLLQDDEELTDSMKKL